MKKYKVLLAGKNESVKDDFFNHMSDVFQPVTTSSRYDDMLYHLKLYEPEIYVCCLNGESRDELARLMAHRTMLAKKEIITVLIGSEEDCDKFQETSFYRADLIFIKPITASAIKEKIVDHMEELEREKEEEERLEQERLEKERQEKERLEKERQEREQRKKEQKKRGRKHVLVIDDDPMMLKLIKEHLHEKYDVATAISGKIALKFLESKETDFILLDYEMPGENGPQVLEKIKQNKKLTDIPVVFLTGITEQSKIKQALKLKPQGYLLKPIDREKLLDVIERLI